MTQQFSGNSFSLIRNSSATAVRTVLRYDGNGKLIAIRYNGTEYYYVSNILGDVTGIVDISNICD